MIFDQLDFKEEKVMDNEKIEKLQQMIDESNKPLRVFQTSERHHYCRE